LASLAETAVRVTRELGARIVTTRSVRSIASARSPGSRRGRRSRCVPPFIARASAFVSC